MFPNKGLKGAIKKNFGTVDEDYSYFAWYDNIHSIGCGVVTSALLKRIILEPEHVSIDRYFAVKGQKGGIQILGEGVSLATCFAHEVL